MSYMLSSGDTSEIIKEMYDFKDKIGRHLTLRPEGTAGVVRAFVETNFGPEHAKPLQSLLYRLCSVMNALKPADNVNLIRLG